MKEIISASDFKRIVQFASAGIDANRQLLNEMNVFPVPDGDTGVNMALTMKAAATAVSSLNPETVSQVADATASALLRGARGNSGVILSLLFRGFAKACAGKETLDAKTFAEALAGGVSAAYRAVMKPAEGTILTVSRRASEQAVVVAETTSDILALLDATIAEAKIALDETMELNPVLKKAGVVDAGGKGWVIVLEAMSDALSGKELVITETSDAVEGGASFADEDVEITFTYCTEFIVTLSAAGEKMEVSKLRALLESIGDCVVVVDDDEIIKVHVHTNNPDRALGEALKYGDLINIKIENMREQHTQKVVAEEARANASKSVKPEKKYGFVTIGVGEGIKGVFNDLGVDQIVEGGQTMNPSTQDILAAIDKTPAEVVFVLPNNKNIIMAAQQTIDLSDKQVVVIGTKSIPQGVSALLAFNPDAEVEENREAMTAAAENVRSGSITYAARDSEFDGHTIASGEYLALCESKLSSNGADLEAVADELFNQMKVEETGFITIFYGEGVEEADAAMVQALCQKKAPDAEVMLLDGGQPVYYYLISAE
ncbi:MAG: DAK2 domain-containing protein [Clostridia bacterium]|nr:DAK2 domain-containing protein [Clostridia bacterium]